MTELFNTAKIEIKQHFESWSGGWPPTNIYECRTYVDYAMQGDYHSELVYEWLKSQIDGWEELIEQPNVELKSCPKPEDFGIKTITRHVVPDQMFVTLPAGTIVELPGMKDNTQLEVKLRLMRSMTVQMCDDADVIIEEIKPISL